MKKFRILYLLGLLVVLATACESDNNEFDADRTTIVGFTDKSKNINSIPEGGSKSTTVKVFVNDVSTEDRTFNVIEVPIEDPVTNPPTDAGNYSFPSSLVIPANSRVGEIEVTGIDVTITDERSYFSIAIEGSATVVSGTKSVIGLRN
ncbi:hypothetical protein [Aequorivita sp. Q41]|uniref:hypothetical protein n=1 Tax=Aequorivita sp. Q41 TaxID=3153300 RepID=UPI003242ADEB